MSDKSSAAPVSEPASDTDAPLSDRQVGLLLASILIVSLCGIVYQLIVGSVSSYLLGNSVYQFSMTIGFFMFAMGVGSQLSRFLGQRYVENFIWVEIAIALIGGISGIVLFMAFPFARVLYEFVMYALILGIGVLVGLEIPILTTLLSRQQSMKESIANVLSLDYVGALIGSVMFPLLLLPWLGPIRASFAIGLLNILVAIVNVQIFKPQLPRYRLMMAACATTLALLVGMLGFGTWLTSFAEKHLYFDQIVYSQQTPYQKLIVTKSVTDDDVRLYIDGHIQFSERDEYRYHEYLVHPAMAVEGKRSKVLILGGGDGLAAREVLKYPDVEQIDLVDIDPEMIRISSELPMLARMNQNSLTSERLTSYAEDAFTFINQPGVLYDRVIIDFPDPHNETIGKLYSREFYTMVARRLAPDGVIVSQSSSPFFTRRVYWSIEQTMASVFDDTASYQTALPSFGIWGFHMARKGADLPQNYEITVPTRAINQRSMLAAFEFDKDMDKIDSPVNSIMQPVIYTLYLDDLEE